MTHLPWSSADLLRGPRGLPPTPRSRLPPTACYDPSVDRPATFRLSRRSRFWPGTDDLTGDEWRYWYGDIAVPVELQEPHPRPQCLGNEARLDTALLKQMGSRLVEEQQRTSYHPLPSLRHRAFSAEPSAASAIQATQQTMDHVENARRIRADSVNRLQETKRSIVNTVTFRDQSVTTKKTKRQADSFESGSSATLRHRCPRPRTYTDLQGEYDGMLDRMGVTKELTVRHGRRRVLH